MENQILFCNVFIFTNSGKVHILLRDFFKIIYFFLREERFFFYL